MFQGTCKKKPRDGRTVRYQVGIFLNASTQRVGPKSQVGSGNSGSLKHTSFFLGLTIMFMMLINRYVIYVITTHMIKYTCYMYLPIPCIPDIFNQYNFADKFGKCRSISNRRQKRYLNRSVRVKGFETTSRFVF